MPRDARALRRRAEPVPARQRAQPPERGIRDRRTGLVAAADRDPSRADGRGADRRARRPDARPRARGRRLRPDAPHAGALARGGARDRTSAAAGEPHPAARWARVRVERRQHLAPTGRPPRHRRHRQGPRRRPARAATAEQRAMGDRLRRRSAGQRTTFEIDVRHPLTRRDGSRLELTGGARRHVRHRHADLARRGRHGAPPHPRSRDRRAGLDRRHRRHRHRAHRLEAEALAKAALLSGPPGPAAGCAATAGSPSSTTARSSSTARRARARSCDWRFPHDPDHDHVWWLISRSAGVVALVLVAVSVLIGLTLAAGLGGPPRAVARWSRSTSTPRWRA